MNQNGEKAFTLIVIMFSAIWLVNIQPVFASKTIVVPIDYPTISEAINHASDGDTIFVRTGVYYENLQVNKSISIIGENNRNTLIIGSGGIERGSKFIVTFNVDGVKLIGFTLQSQNYTNSNVCASGISIKADHCVIQNNIIQNCYIGLFSSVQSYTLIAGNIIKSNFKDGMRFYSGSYNTISNNTIVDNTVSGIALQGYSNNLIRNTFENNFRGLGLGSSYSVVFENKFLSNTESGMWLAGSKNIIAANEIANNKWGVYLTPQWAAPHDNTFYHNNFIGNTYGVFVNESAPIEFWDNGALGNFWSDYHNQNPNAKEIGNSGIADTPYTVYDNVQDEYPLVAPFDTAKIVDSPAPYSSPSVVSNGLVASWSFDSIDSNGISLDSTGNNPAILGSTTAIKSYIPQTVNGKSGKALAFDGQQYIMVPASASLEISGEATVDVWINMQSYKEIPYNNIIVEALRTTDALPTRTFGLAINGEVPQNDTAPELGAIRAYILTKDGLNEIVTANSIVTPNEWIHVVFTRSLKTGMHIYVDGKEQQVIVTAGIANPQGATLRQTETYIGHDAVCTIDELKLSNTAMQSTDQTLWNEWWLWIILFAVIVAIGLVIYRRQYIRSS